MGRDGKTSRKQTARNRAAGQPGRVLWQRIKTSLAAAGVLGLALFMALGDSAVPDGIPDGTHAVAVEDPSHVVEAIAIDGGEVPAGGPHAAQWLNCGFYGEQVAAENALHSLEHGAVWITHRPDIDDSAVRELRSLANRRRKVIVSPMPGQVSALKATAWGVQLDLDETGDSRLVQFLNEFEGAGSAPEPGAVCSGGIGSPLT